MIKRYLSAYNEYYEVSVEGAYIFYYNWVHTSFCFFLFHQHVRHKMILMIKRYLSAYNEYYEVSVEGAYINMKLRTCLHIMNTMRLVSKEHILI